MSLVDVIISCLDSIRQASEHIEGATVYLDAGCTESFQFIGAHNLLLELGALSVCSLENASKLDTVVDWTRNPNAATKVVIFTSRLLSDAHRYILRCLSTHHNVSQCIILTSISEMAHSAYPDSPLGPDAFHEYQSLLVQDYEEVLKRSDKKTGKFGENKFNEDVPAEDEGWSQLTSSEENIPLPEAASLAKEYGKHEHGVHAEDAGTKLVVSVHHFPLIFCPLSPRVFVLPSEGSVAEAYLSSQNENALSPGLPPLSSGSSLDGEDVSPGATLTAQFLYHLASKMDLKMEIFSLGGLSKTVGKQLTGMSSLYDVGRRKRSAGLLLIDRTLDLLTPCSHGDSLIDRVFSALPRRERTKISSNMKGTQTPACLQRAPLDVQIPLLPIISEQSNSQLLKGIEAFLHGWDSTESPSEAVEVDGSLVSTESFRGTPYLDAILDRRTKDGAILIRKWLQETLRRENINPNVKIRPGFASKTELQTLVKALSGSQSSLLRNKGIIQLGAAALYALDELHSSKWDAFISAEKMLNVSAEDTSQSLAAQISDLINKSALNPSPGLLTFQEALLLAVSGYILAGQNFPTSGSNGPFSWQEEHFMKEAIVDAVLENPGMKNLKFLNGLTRELEATTNKKNSEGAKQESTSQSQTDDFDFDEDDEWGNWGDEDTDKGANKEQVYDDMQLKLELRDKVDSLFKFLHKLSSLKLGMESSFNGDFSSSKGLIYKLLTRVLGKHDIPGLEYHSSTVGRIFKSGFGRFGLGQAKPSLADQSVILVFVIGGINGIEVREAQEALNDCGRPDTELILGGTTFLTPNDMYDLLLGDLSYI